MKIPTNPFKERHGNFVSEGGNKLLGIMPVQATLDRSQIQFFALDQLVELDSIVRVIDLFCQFIDYDNPGFRVKGKSHEDD